MFESTKFRVLEIIIKCRNVSFNDMRVALMQGLPELSWEEITDYIVLLKSEGYIKVLIGDDELQAIALEHGVIARVREMHGTADNEKLKELLGIILGLLKISF